MQKGVFFELDLFVEGFTMVRPSKASNWWFLVEKEVDSDDSGSLIYGQVFSLGMVTKHCFVLESSVPILPCWKKNNSRNNQESEREICVYFFNIYIYIYKIIIMILFMYCYPKKNYST